MKNRLKVWHKILIVIVSFSLPIVVLLYFFTLGISHDIAFSQFEIYGNSYQRPLEQLLRHVSEHKVYVSRQALGVTQSGADLGRIEAAVDEDFKNLSVVQLDLGEKLKVTPEELTKRNRAGFYPDELKTQWEHIKRESATSTSAARFDAHTRLLLGIRGLIAHIGDTSNLILDPDLDTYYLMDVTLLALPQMQDRMQEVISLADRLSHSDTLTFDDRVTLSIFMALVRQSDLDRVNASSQTALTEDQNFLGETATLQENLPKALERNTKATEDFLEVLEEMVTSENVSTYGGELTVTASRAMESVYGLWDVAVDELDVMLASRVNNHKSRLYVAVASTMTAMLASAVLVFFIIKSITQVLSRAVVTTSQLTQRVTTASTQLQSSIQTISSSIRLIVVGAQEQSAKIEQTSAFIAGISQSAKQIEQSVGSAIDSSTKTAVAAQNGGLAGEKAMEGISQVKQVVAGSGQFAKTLVEKSKSIDQVVETISKIAEQTNLLALNAAIEAARAGEAGHGFAVVADEVRKLAESSAGSAGEIRELIAGIARQIEETVSSMEQGTQTVDKNVALIGEALSHLQKIASMAQEVSARVGEIQTAVTRQNENTEQVKRTMSELSSVASKNASASSEVSTAVQEQVVTSKQISSTVTELSAVASELSRVVADNERGFKAVPIPDVPKDPH